ncbi:TetR family transcriptional regulator C-terminal domain-containing protein [Verrucosispora sp. WMMD573]|uniref:TetR/AcrR family transcriptional regulator n=1 Tax=Verrucosispora sp. WMMD573 TaxID=3015149 RepID=UPI00248CE177|nr:TetR family transcriptional regulator C-terminal domain-containing protein [Verrucosispora sp. WMMD573]WBB53120.1 TetR family transcriptional regulator C-terminal domain-containing protein [Verrucosispora sp. WMMD573]
MPRKVDRQERRTLIADALMRVAAEQGLEAISLRHVAAAAGVSAGMVQHYFRTKDEMMSFAMSVVRDRGQARVADAVAALGDRPPPRTLLRTMITALLPLDGPSREDGRVTLAFLAYTAVRPQAATLVQRDHAQMTAFVAGLLPVPHGDDSAAGLLALMEGLGIHLLSGSQTPQQALRALDHHLDLIFDPPVRAGERGIDTVPHATAADR